MKNLQSFDSLRRKLRRRVLLLDVRYKFWKIRMVFLYLEFLLIIRGWQARKLNATAIVPLIYRVRLLTMTDRKATIPLGQPSRRNILFVKTGQIVLFIIRGLFGFCCAMEKATRPTPQPIRHWCRRSLYGFRSFLRVRAKSLA